jgi:hypothetical protein
MSEIEALQSFRAGVSGPSPDVVADARARLLAVAARQRAGSRGRRRFVRLAVAAGLASVIGAAALAVAALTGGPPGVVERAEAAVAGGDRILHVIVRITDPSGTSREEAWVRTDGSLGHSVSLSGERGADCTSTATQLRCYDAASNVVDVYRYNPDAVQGAGERALPGYSADDPDSLALALRSGYAQPLGETVIAGRSVHAIRLAVPLIAADAAATPRFPEESAPILYVDRDTYLPVAQRFPDGGSTTVYERYEFLPDDTAHAPLLALGAPADARVVVHPIGEGPES